MGNELRKRVMAQAGGESGPLFKFPSVNVSGYQVTNGNHMYFSKYIGQKSIFALSLGTYQISDNNNLYEKVDNKPKLFTLHTGDEVEIVATITSRSRGFEWYVGLRKANDSDDALNSTQDSTMKQTISATIADDVDVSTFYFYLRGTGVTTTFEADFEMYVNGIRYV